jgi:virulence factor Mce-like protein
MIDFLNSRLATRIGLGACVAVGLYLLLFTGGSGRTLRAEFTDARGLLVGNTVRVNGAGVGSVSGVTLTRRGTALVTMSLDANAPAPHQDAAATIRPVDLLGDIYVSYSPGNSAAMLHGPIPLSRTENLPRLSDLLQAFTPGARAGAQALIVNLGLGLEQRGVDLNRAAVTLRPALTASDRVVAEFASQNANLESLITNSEHLTAQLAGRAPQLDSSVRAIAQTLANTAAHATELNAGLGQLAPTIVALGRTTGELTTTAHGLEPLAAQLGSVAPGLTHTLGALPGFLTQAQLAITATRPTLRAAGTFLQDGDATFPAVTRALTSAQSGAQATDALLTTGVQLAPLLAQSLFDNVASETSEPGNEPLDNEDPLRNYWRGAAVLSCQSFGLAIKPGCLQTYLASTTDSRTPARTPARPGAGTRARNGAPPTTKTASGPGAPQPPPPTVTTPASSLGSTLSGLLGTAGQLLHGGAGSGSSSGTSGQGSASSSNPPGSGLGSLLHYLLGR